jgi:hypothetical protein
MISSGLSVQADPDAKSTITPTGMNNTKTTLPRIHQDSPLSRPGFSGDSFS